MQKNNPLSEFLSSLSKEISFILINNYKGKQNYDEIQSLCPFHHEENPSFGFNLKKGAFKCFSCGIQGNVKELAQQLNIPIPTRKTKNENQKLSPEELYQIHHKTLLKAKLDYWNNRGIQKESLKLGSIGISQDYNHIISDTFPYFDQNKKFIAFKTLPREKKQRSKNTRWSPSGQGSPLYGLWFLKDYDQNKPLILCEGEKDFWVLKQNDFQVLGIPSASTYVKANNKHLKNFSDIYILFDNDTPGHNGSLNVLRKLERGFICRWELLNGVSEGVNDVNDLYLKHPEDFKSIIEKLLKNAINPLDDDSKDNDEINSRHDNYKNIDVIRINPQLLSFQKKREIGKYIFDQLTLRGKWFYTRALEFYYFENDTRELLDFHTMQFQLFLHKEFGINKAGTEYEYILNELISLCKQFGKETTIYQTTHYSKSENTLYIYNNNHSIFKVTENKVTKENNGTDGILFLKDPLADPFDPDLNKSISEEQKEKLLNIIFDNPNYHKDSTLSITEARTIFGLWFYSLFFEEIQPTKPILTIMGEKRSGKSFSMKVIKNLFLGEPLRELYELDDNKNDADHFISSNYFWFIDNMDEKLVGKKGWVENWMTSLATRKELSKRKLYTDKENIRIVPRGFSAITTRTPYFRRDDVADRLLIIEVERREEGTTEDILYHNLNDNRNDIWLCILEELKNILASLKTEYNKSIQFRMADFAKFCFQIAQNNNSLDQIENIFQKLSSKQSDFTLEDNPILDTLLMWIDREPLDHDFSMSKDSNSGSEISARDLFKQLKEIAQEEELITFPKTPKSFGQKLKNIKSNLGKYFDIKTRTGKARMTFWTFTKKEGIEI